MTTNPSRLRLATALAVAVVVDILQCPAALAWFAGVGGPVEWLLNEGLDIATMGLLTALVGFHWAFIPAFVVESLPFVDIAPTWTGSLLFAKWKELRSLFSSRAALTPGEGKPTNDP